MSSVGRNQIFLVVVNNSYDFPRGATLLVALEVETMNAAEDISDAVKWGAERIISHSSTHWLNYMSLAISVTKR
jgi:hypothetical protein